MSELLETPLHDWHVAHGGKMVDFAGWHMPVQYSGVVDEHTAVRQLAGLFDVSHMGEVRISGADALANVQRLTVNDASALQVGQAQYSAMVTPEGGVVDDLLVYKFGPDEYLLVVNAGTTPKDVAWMREHVSGDVTLLDESPNWAQLAVQGPRAESILARVITDDLASIGYYRFVQTTYGGEPAIVSRTGYTGEDGFEVYLASDLAVGLADRLLDAGAGDGLIPAGLGARDTLRLEAGMLLYGNDMDESRSPIEARLGWIVKLDKGDFIGREALLRHKSEGTAQVLVGVEITGRGIPRHGYVLCSRAGEEIGTVTSGTFSPTLRKGVGLGYVNRDHASPDTELAVEIRGRAVAARVVRPPFYRRQK